MLPYEIQLCGALIKYKSLEKDVKFGLAHEQQAQMNNFCKSFGSDAEVDVVVLHGLKRSQAQMENHPTEFCGNRIVESAELG